MVRRIILSFDWSKFSPEVAEQHHKHIMEDPHNCDDCGDTYNRNDLLKQFGDNFLVCKNCVELYGQLYK